MHILSPETDNCPSWISGRERMTVENISWSISTKECCRPRRGLNPRPPGLQSDGASNWATEVGNLLVTIRNEQANDGQEYTFYVTTPPLISVKLLRFFFGFWKGESFKPSTLFIWPESLWLNFYFQGLRKCYQEISIRLEVLLAALFISVSNRYQKKTIYLLFATGWKGYNNVFQ